MAYKKYIKRNGKLYGPYLYESKRVDGKVVSEYHGSEEPRKIKGVRVYDYKKILFLFLGIFILAILIYFLFTLPHNKLSGKAVLGVETSYVSGEPLEGVLKLSLKEGELLPASSKIVFENSGNTYEFPLNEVIEDSLSEGNYYLENKLIQGSGEGYGDEGKIEVYPEIKFILQIYNEVSEEETVENESGEEAVEAVTEEEGSPTPITGGFLGSLFGVTGRVSMELQEEVEGIVSKDKPFIYELKEAEKVELKPRSVSIGGEEVSDNLVSLKIENNILTITTDYSENAKGFGEEYLGYKEKTLSLDLSDLNLVLEEGDLNIKFVYDNEEILHLSTVLKDGEMTEDELLEEVSEEEPEEGVTEEEVVELPNETDLSNETILENESVEEIIESSLWDMGNFLTDEERDVLLDNFGDIQLKTVKSELFKGRIIIVYDFAGYSVEYSYDSSINKDVLDVNMEKDRIKFLKDIANSLMEEEESPTPLEGFNESYTP